MGVLKAKGKLLQFDDTLWVHFGGVEAVKKGNKIEITGLDEDSYLKVLNQFGRVLKLYSFEGGKWMDSETGQAPSGFDEGLAGKIEPQALPTKKSGSTRKARSKTTGKSKTVAKTTTKPKVAKTKAKTTGKSKTVAKTVAKPKAAKAKPKTTGKTTGKTKTAAKPKANGKSKKAGKAAAKTGGKSKGTSKKKS